MWTETTPQMFFPGFVSVGASSTKNVWAVGENDADREQPVAERWTGSRWVLHFGALPNPTGTPDGGFFGVTALAAADVWAVGWMDMGNSNSHAPLAERWNGTAWRIIPTPPAASGGTLNAVSAVSRADIWAVGANASGGPLVMHWNGAAWQLRSAPGATPLASVKAVNASNVWAVGGNVVEHYNGSSWNRVRVPLASTITLNQINRVPGTRHLWAVGWNTDTTGNETPLAIYYNGSAWLRRTPPIAAGRLNGVAANSDGDAWVSGVDFSAQPDPLNVTAHWNGSKWTVSTPAGLANGLVENMTRAPNSTQLFAVGFLLSGDGPFAAYYHH